MLVFALRFLRWVSIGDADEQSKPSGFAFSMPTTAIIGLSIAAGPDRTARCDRAPSRPRRAERVLAGLAATALLLAIGVYSGRAPAAPISVTRSAWRSA